MLVILALSGKFSNFALASSAAVETLSTCSGIFIFIILASKGLAGSSDLFWKVREKSRMALVVGSS